MIFLDVRLILDLEHGRLKIVQWRITTYWRSFRITAWNPSKDIPRVIRRPCRRASSDLSGFGSGYCGSLIYDEGGMRKEFLW